MSSDAVPRSTSPACKRVGTGSANERHRPKRKETAMRARLALTVLALALLLPACGSTVSRIQSDPSGLDPALGLTVLAVQTPGPAWIEDIGEDAAGCATSALAKVPKARLVKTEEFRRAVLPN